MMKKALCSLLALVLAMLPLYTSAEGWLEILTDVQVSAREVNAATEEAPAENKPEDWWNILLLGGDTDTLEQNPRTDSMIILSVNTQLGQVKMTSLMRDTWIKVPGKSSHRKLTELCAVGGPELTIRAINENFGTEIEDYVFVSLEGIAEIIDVLGGIELDVTEAERKALNRGLFDLSPYSGMEELEESGEGVHLNGNQATAYARIRNIDSDFVRTERQRTVLVTLAKKILSGADMGTLLAVVTKLLGYVDTNLGLIDIMSLADLALNLDFDSIQELRLPADGTYESGTFDGIWCIKPNFRKNEKILQEFIYG